MRFALDSAFIYVLHRIRLVCYSVCNTDWGFWTTAIDHQKTNWGNCLWTNRILPSSKVQTCRINAKLKGSCFGSLCWPDTFYFVFIFYEYWQKMCGGHYALILSHALKTISNWLDRFNIHALYLKYSLIGCEDLTSREPWETFPKGNQFKNITW